MEINKKLSNIIWVSLSTILLSNCSTVKVSKTPFGSTSDGTAVDLFTLENANGMQAKITNYGGIVTQLHVPDQNGELGDVVLGYDKLSSYIKASPYFGCITGRYANRIAKGQFKIGEAAYKLATNNGENHLHGGNVGFDKQVWAAKEVTGLGKAGIELTYLSKDGEEGYPGNLDSKVTYWLTNQNELEIEYEAKTDKATPINLTHHSYFNLAGEGSGNILGHEVEIFANTFVPTDAGNIPLGELKKVTGTPFDFLTPHKIGERIEEKNQQLEFGKGYDHNWVINDSGNSLNLAARVTEPRTGRVMEVLTDQPGIQFYTGNFLDGSNIGKGNKVYNHRNAFCLETQVHPDSPNQPDFPNSILKPGETYRHVCIYRFKTK
ncbi:galactose mutarotase [Verrucomicrobia bacterium]|nr:galactose mutarotase [Verrucomicrobiota bacterium]|tara:strand:+ start:1104 stop:2237 length:1134 start_codon:yes stop_codon:yes gene_type:complete